MDGRFSRSIAIRYDDNAGVRAERNKILRERVTLFTPQSFNSFSEDRSQKWLKKRGESWLTTTAKEKEKEAFCYAPSKGNFFWSKCRARFF